MYMARLPVLACFDSWYTAVTCYRALAGRDSTRYIDSRAIECANAALAADAEASEPGCGCALFYPYEEHISLTRLDEACRLPSERG